MNEIDDGIRIGGPFYKSSNPYGDKATCHRDEWFIFRILTGEEVAKEMSDPDCSELRRTLLSLSHERCIGTVVKPHRRNEYVIGQLHPDTAFVDLDSAIDFLVENENKITFCT